jgi:hypothetical protein
MDGFEPWQGGKGVVRKLPNEGKGSAWGYMYYVEVTEVPAANKAISKGWQTYFKPEWLRPVEKPAGAEDVVNHPSHYTQYPVEVIELTRHMPFCDGNVVKYVARSPFKGNRLQDLKKARWYLDDAIAEEEKKLSGLG